MTGKNLRKKYRVKKKTPLWKSVFFQATILFTLLLFSALYFFLINPFFRIDKVFTEGASEISTEEVVNITERYISKSIFLVSLREIKKDLLVRIPRINEANLSRVFPNTIKVVIKERVPVGVVCFDNSKDCFKVDGKGVVFDKGSVYDGDLVFFISEKESVLLGESVIYKDKIAVMKRLNESLGILGIKISFFRFSEEKLLSVFMSEGWRIDFSLGDNTNEQIDNLIILLKEEIGEERSFLEYIDMRYGDRIYYK